MPKKIKNCFYKNLTFEKLMKAHQRARVHKTYKNEVISFELNLENNIVNLLNNIKNKKYRLGDYYTFTIYEPKERIIKALPYRDRIVHQWYVEEFIKPYIVPKFINTSYACLKDKGTHKAVQQVEKQLREFKRNYGDFWILKCDIKKFFYSIDPYVLFNIMEKYISDKELLAFTKLLIFDGRESSDIIGIPIRKLYKSIFYPYKMGVNFCGYRIFTTHRLLRTNSKKKMKRNVKHWNKKYINGTLDILTTMQSINSWLGHSNHCNSYKLQQKVLNSCEFLYTNSDDINRKIENELISLIENDISKADD